MTAEAAPVAAGGQVVVAADRPRSGSGQPERQPQPPVEAGHRQRGGHRPGGHRGPLEQRHGLAAVVGPGPGLLAARLSAAERGVAEPCRAPRREHARERPPPGHFAAFFLVGCFGLVGLADGVADALGAGLGTDSWRTP